MRKYLRRWLLSFLGIEERLETIEHDIQDIARHFVTQRAPDGRPTETLADRQAKRDGNAEPGLLHRGRNWNQTKRFLEASDAAQALRRPRKTA